MGLKVDAVQMLSNGCLLKVLCAGS
uniref:Uncharacterized protein n=1 Tax=Anguilla anguilla TaxID=7936 RepID=A0A0E9TUJ0_ANGAN